MIDRCEKNLFVKEYPMQTFIDMDNILQEYATKLKNIEVQASTKNISQQSTFFQVKLCHYLPC